MRGDSGSQQPLTYVLQLKSRHEGTQPPQKPALERSDPNYSRPLTVHFPNTCKIRQASDYHLITPAQVLEHSKHILMSAAKVLQMVSPRNTVWPESTGAKMWLMSQICIIYIKHLDRCKCVCEPENGYGDKRGERWKSSSLTLNHLKHGRSPSLSSGSFSEGCVE